MTLSGRPWSTSLTAIAALLLVALGITMLFRPYASLAALVLIVAVGALMLSIGDFLDFRRNPADRHELLTAILWLVIAIAALVFAGGTIRLLAAVAGFGLIVNGLLRIRTGWKAAGEERYTAVLLGAASLILGLLALGWPGLTLSTISVLFGLWLVAIGLIRLWHLLRGETRLAGDSPSRWMRWGRVVAAAGALGVALILLGLRTFVRSREPAIDAFYDPPDNVPADAGALLRTEPFTRNIPDTATAWRILYTTTDSHGEPAVASGIVLVASEVPEGPRPVIAWAHGTTGVDRRCAPSVLDEPFHDGAPPALDEVIANGWILVATDYIGLGTEGPHPYVIGEGEARSVLDAIRAARQLEEIEMADTTIVWGHSQGGHAALWTGLLAPQYAPELDISGVAAMSPASDLPALVEVLDNLPGGSIFGSFVATAYSEIYDDVSFDHYVRPGARVVLREMATRCLSEPETFVSVIESFLLGQSPWRHDGNTGPMGVRLQENVPAGEIPAPVLLGQGLADPLILPAAQDGFVEQMCGLGNQIDYRTYEGYDHVGVVTGDSPLIPELVAWTQDRIDGQPATSTC